MELPSIDRNASREGYKRLRADLLEIQSRIDGISATADSPDGLITVTVLGRGEISELRIDPRIYRSPNSKALAASIVDTIRDATRLAEQKLFAITRQYLPENAKHQFDKKIAGGRP